MKTPISTLIDAVCTVRVKTGEEMLEAIADAAIVWACEPSVSNQRELQRLAKELKKSGWGHPQQRNG